MKLSEQYLEKCTSSSEYINFEFRLNLNYISYTKIDYSVKLRVSLAKYRSVIFFKILPIYFEFRQVFSQIFETIF